MEESTQLFKAGFQSSTGLTPEFNAFYKLFKQEFTALVKPYVKNITYHRGHFELYGFLTTNSGKIYYFKVGDVRWWNYFLIRTAKNYQDYTGGVNNDFPLETISDNIFRFVK